MRFEGLSSEDAGFAAVRTTTPSGNGRAGLSYPGLTPSQLLDGDSVVIGLRQNGADRSNLALANAGTSGTIRLKVYIVKGDGSEAVYLDPDYELGPGQWTQIGGVLTAPNPDYADGWIFIERTSGTEPYTAYAVFNDNITNDGSYVPAVPADTVDAFGTVPVLVESGTFQSELVVANLSDEPGYAFLEYTESNAAPGESTGLFYVELASLEQAIFPDIIEELRGSGATIGPRGPTLRRRSRGRLLERHLPPRRPLRGPDRARPRRAAGSTASSTRASRAASPPSTPGSSASSRTRRRDRTSPSSTPASSTSRFASASRSTTAPRAEGLRGDDRTSRAGQWFQKNAILGGVANGYVHLTVVEGFDAFFAYGVVNDGATSTSGTNDGSYVPMIVVQ